MILTVVVVDIVRSFWQTPLTLVNSLSIRHDLDASGGSVPSGMVLSPAALRT